jgi:hypothetical protein
MYQQIISSLNGKSQDISCEAQNEKKNSVHLFDVNEFVQEMAVSSHDKNKQMYEYQENLNAYDLASNCSRQIVLKILNYPVESYKDSWLPLKFRAALGTTVHNFIQDNCSVFTEKEVSIKVPSIKTSVRLDALISDNVLCEIKSCTFSDYETVLRTRTPRDADFYQSVFYRWLLHNHLKEAKQQIDTRTSPPNLDNYNIRYIQLIYVAHDLLSSDINSISEAKATMLKIKKMLRSRFNQFYFITALTLDLNVINIDQYETYIVGKLYHILSHLKNKTIPPLDDPYIKNNCFFCPYKNICNTIY